MTVLPTSRIAILDAPVLAPGVCTMCGSAGGDGRKFLDYGKQLDWYGAVYFCTECVKEFAQAVDYIPVDAFNAQAQELAELQVKYDQLNKRYGALSDALRSILDDNSSSVDDLVRSAFSSVEESEQAVEPNVQHDVGDSKTEQSVGVEGSDDVFDPSDFD